MIADFNSLQGGLIFDASQAALGVNETSDQNHLSAGFKIRSVQYTVGHTRATHDPKHHHDGLALSSTIESQNFEIQGL